MFLLRRGQKAQEPLYKKIISETLTSFLVGFVLLPYVAILFSLLRRGSIKL